MRSIVVIPVLLIAVIVAAMLHAGKNTRSCEDDANVEKVMTGLTGIDTVLPAHTNVTTQITGVDFTVEIWAGLFLAPRYCINTGNLKTDTILSICAINYSDSVLRSIPGDRKVIRSNKNSFYQFYLTCSK